MRRTAILITSALVTAAALTGCATRQVDLERTGAQKVEGAGGLYAFCRGPLGIYFTNYAEGTSDDYEFIVYDDPFCEQDEPSIDEPAQPTTAPAVPSSDPSPNVSESQSEDEG